MNWCGILHMWCDDIDTEDMELIGCGGNCNICLHSEESTLKW
nr:MAG TPA: hypothetical protein [Caudoviricetes sp.]